MNPSAQISSPSVASQTAVSPVEKLVVVSVLLILLAGIALGAVMSAKRLHQRVLASNPATVALLYSESTSDATVTRFV